MTKSEVSAHEHYEVLLAKRYAWMLGDHDVRVAAELETLQRLGVPATDSGEVAVDLGCGSGLHTRVLLELGYSVRAVDHSATILAGLDGLPVEVVNADLADFDVGSARVVACMGDTLSHLADASHVEQVLRKWQPQRILALSFRDLRHIPTGADRFFLVRSDADRIHTCFLEDAGRHVRVHDIFHERTADGWSLRKSAYLKLRIDPDAVARMLEEMGARVLRSESNSGMITLVAH